MGKQFDACIINLGKYVEGNLVDTWVEFPTTKRSINESLEKIGIGKDYKEIMVEDIDFERGDFPNLKDIFGEYTSLSDLNLIARLMDDLSMEELKRAEFFVVSGGGMSIEELGNLLLQTDQIPYNLYTFPGIENCEGLSEQEKYAYTITYQNGTYEKLKEIGMENYIDFEAIGRDAVLNGEVTLFQDGYINCMALDQVRLDLYSWEELYASAGLDMDLESTPEQDLKEQIERKVRRIPDAASELNYNIHR